MSENAKLSAWVQEIVNLCQPDAVHWCDGSQQEYESMLGLMLESGTARKLNPKKRPNSYIVFSDPADVGSLTLVVGALDALGLEDLGARNSDGAATMLVDEIDELWVDGVAEGLLDDLDGLGSGDAEATDEVGF